MDKKTLRAEIKKLRDLKSDREEESKILCEKILELEEYQRAEKILSFMNFGSEVEIESLNQKILEANKKLYLPRVEKDGELSIVEYGEGFSIGSFGIREPIGKSYFGELDLIITPGLAFDREGNRLGYGKGYYDRVFTCYSEVLKVAPIFDVQLVEKVPTEEHDIKIDVIIIKNEILRIKKY